MNAAKEKTPLLGTFKKLAKLLQPLEPEEQARLMASVAIMLGCEDDLVAKIRQSKGMLR